MVAQSFLLSLVFASLIGLLLNLRYRMEFSATAELSRSSPLIASWLPDGVVKFTAATLSFEQALRQLETSIAFRDEVTACITSSSNAALYLEFPPLTRNNMAKSHFEFVLVPAPHLSSSTDSSPFKSHLEAQSADCTAISFKNLGGDATLIVPCQRRDAPPHAYAHLAAFMRHAAADQFHGWWALLAKTALEHLAAPASASTISPPLWVSTSGDGVAFLHGRLDSRPKCE